MWLGKALPMFWCLMKKEIEHEELAFVQYRECVPPSYRAYEAVRCFCLRWATLGSAKKGHNVEKEGEVGDAVAVGEWFEVVRLQSVMSMANVDWAYIAVHPVTRELPWSNHQIIILVGSSGILRGRGAGYKTEKDFTWL